MANAEAWNQGWSLGTGRAEEDRAHKQKLKDQAHDTMVNEKHDLMTSLQSKIPTLKKLDASGNLVDTPESLAAMNQLTQTIQERNELLDPSKHPGAFQRLASRIGLGPKTQTPIAPQRISSTTEPGVASSTVPGMDTGSTVAFPASSPTTVKSPKGQSTTTNPQDVQLPAGATAPVYTPELPAYKGTPSVGTAQQPGQYAPGTPKELLERAKRMQQANTEAGEFASAAPLSPEQQAEIQAKAGIAGDEAKAEWQLDFAKRHNLSPEAVQELTEKIAGVPTVKVPKPIGVPFRDANDGKWYQRTQDPLTGEFKQVEVPGYSQTARPSTSKYNENLAAYARKHGIAVDQIPEEGLDYVNRMMALDAAMPSSTTSTTLKLDAEGQFRPITETNSRNPGAGVNLVDPLGPVKKEESSKASGKGTSPSALKKEAESRKPQTPTGSTSTGATGGGRTKVGPALFPGPNKELTDQQTTFDGAVKRAKRMDESYADTKKPGNHQQAMMNLIANHIGMTLGAQKGARINQAVWNEAVASAPWIESQAAKWFHRDSNGDLIFDGFKGGVTLTEDQMKQMVELAHESVDTEKQGLDTVRQRLKLPTGDTSQTSDWKSPAGAPDASQYPDGHELYNKRTNTVDAVARGGKWTKPQQ